jgi:hypothetical protein
LRGRPQLSVSVCGARRNGRRYFCAALAKTCAAGYMVVVQSAYELDMTPNDSIDRRYRGTGFRARQTCAACRRSLA